MKSGKEEDGERTEELCEVRVYYALKTRRATLRGGWRRRDKKGLRDDESFHFLTPQTLTY